MYSLKIYNCFTKKIALNYFKLAKLHWWLAAEIIKRQLSSQSYHESFK